MVTKKTLKVYGFTSLEEYFDYVLESKNNGQLQQSRELFNELSEGMQGQRVAFFDYVEETYFYEVEYENEMSYEIRNLREFFMQKAR
jgi:hypothetical protein